MDLTSLAGQQAAIFQQDFTKDEAPLSFAHQCVISPSRAPSTADAAFLDG